MMERCSINWLVAGTLLLLWLSVIVDGQDSTKGGHASMETRLYDNIFADYNSYFRPDDQTNVSIALSLASIVNINEQEGHITTTFIPKMVWRDPRLTWNRTKDGYYKIDHLQVPDSSIWVPDVEILNRFKDVSHDSAMKPLVWIHYDGRIYYVPRRTYHTPCRFDLLHFPYDTQSCTIVLGSWAYLKNEVDFTLIDKGVDDDFFNVHTDFHLSSLEMERREELYGEGEIPFVELIVNVTLSRRSSFFYYMYIMPANALLLAIPLVHCLPSRSPTKFVVLGTVLICIVMMLNTLSQFMPGYLSASPPKILSLYVRCTLCTISSAIACCITLSLSNTNVRTKRVPLILRKIIFGRFMLCCENAPTFIDYDYQLLHLERQLQANSDEEGRSQEMSLRDNEEPQESASNDSSGRQRAMVQVLQHLVNEMQLCRYREQVTIEWIKLAQCVDHLFALVFAVASVCIISITHQPH